MKNTTISKLIDKILHESSLDPRIETGIFDIHNYDHMEIMAEHMTEAGVDKKIITEVINELVMDEGKYPERQAFNKDGWLVTFPSKQYRDRALKKGTHSIADPTHGKGGMNKYYKSKGKQQRQTQQDPTQTEPVESPAITPPSAKGSTQKPPTPTERPDNVAPDSPEMTDPNYLRNLARARLGLGAGGKKSSPASTDTSQLPAAGSVDSAATPGAPTPSQTGNSTVTPPVAPPPAPVAPDYAKPSKQFATEKGWKATPYGEWRDRGGNTMAVTGQSGEVVPVQSIFRDELKLFVQKNAPVAAPVAPAAPLPPA